MTLVATKKTMVGKKDDKVTDHNHQVHLPRSIKLNDAFLLPEASAPLWEIEPVADDTASFPPAFWFVGAHGFAGGSTLAAMMAPAGDAGCMWPVHDAYPLCVIVARSTMAGLERAHHVVLQGIREIEPVTVLGIAVVADTPGKTRHLSPISWRF